MKMTELAQKKVHMVGIGGAGMSGIARVMKEYGVSVSGSDLKRSPVTEGLEKLGIPVSEGHQSEFLPSDADIVVYSSAVPPDNPELLSARDRGLEILGRGAMLARLANSHHAIAIAGAHGKTTTTSMIATVLMDCGLEPSFITGGELQVNGIGACTGNGRYFVVEADESDGSFLELHPYAAVVTNVEDDHLDHYQSLEALQKAFVQFMSQVTPGGMAVVCGEDPFLASIALPETIRCLRYGSQDGLDFSMAGWQPCGLGSRFQVLHRGEELGTVELVVPGRHNALNALAAIAVAVELGAEFSRIAASLGSFKGARRRFDMLLKSPLAVVDDYAHHPTEIRATIAAALQAKARRLVVAFQPHRYSRTRQLGAMFGPAFKGADLVVVSDIYAAGEQPLPGVSSRIIHESALKEGLRSLYVPDMADMEAFLQKELQEGDLLLVMGAGDIWQTARNLADYFGRKSKD